MNNFLVTKFTSNDFYIVISIVAIVFVVVICFLIYFIIFDNIILRRKNHKYHENIIGYDYKSQYVYYFDKRKLGGVKKIRVESFIKSFDEHSQNIVEDFLSQAVENIKDINKVVCVDIKNVGSKKLHCFCLLEIYAVNRKKNMIHMREMLFKNLPLVNTDDNKHINSVNYSFKSTNKEIESYFLNNKPFRGVSYIFQFKIDYLINDTNIDIFVFYSFKDIIAKYCKKRVLVDFSNNSFILHDFKVVKHIEALRLLNNIFNDFDLFIELNNLRNKVTYKAGVVEHKYFPKDFSKVIKTLRQTLNEAITKQKKYLFYDTNISNSFYFDQSYKNEIESIIKLHSLKFSFQPVLDINDLSVFGYLSYVRATSKVFSDINEVKQYAYNLGLSKRLFSEILKYLCSKFNNEKSLDTSNLLLFYELKFFELDCCNSLLGYIQNAKNVQLVLVFNEDDILRNLDSKTIIDEFRKISNKSYILGLNITERTLELPDELYNLFSYFIFDSVYFEKTFQDISHSSISLIKAIEKVLKFKKTIILKSVNTLSELEVRVKEGLNYISGDSIGEISDMILPVNKRILNKIKKNILNKKEN